MLHIAPSKPFSLPIIMLSLALYVGRLSVNLNTFTNANNTNIIPIDNNEHEYVLELINIYNSDNSDNNNKL